MNLKRRTLLSGAAAATVEVLLARRLRAIDMSAARPVAPPGDLELLLTAMTPGTLRISIAPANDPVRTEELGVLEPTRPENLRKYGLATQQVIAWGKYEIRVRTAPLRVAVYEGAKLRQEVRFEQTTTHVNFTFDGPVFGLGEGAHPFDRRNQSEPMQSGSHSPDLQTFGARVPVPWIMSPDGWGIFIGQPQGAFRFTQTEAIYYGVEATSTRNVYLLLGESPADVLREYADLTGHPHLPPRWSFGYQQSHRTLTNKEEILSIAQTFREKKLPCDALIYLGTGFCPSGWNTGHGSFTFNDKVFPNPADVIRQFHHMHFRVIAHIVPPGEFHGTVDDTESESKVPGNARSYWAKHIPLIEAGVDGWWPDEGDKLSVYARLQRNRMYWEGPRQVEADVRPFALHRNGYAGIQRYGWLWSGDTFSTWLALKAQIMIGIGAGLSGIPYWGTDTGGFVPTMEYGPELFVRWFQFSTFCPSFRSHGRAWKLHLPWGWNLGESGPKEVEGAWVANWPSSADLHRPDVENICRKFLELRYRLLPYTYSTAAESHATGMPMIRALWLEFPHDSRTLLIDDAYLWGPSILVAPVFEKGAVSRSVYLPEGIWWNFWTHTSEKGGRETTVQASLETLPLFVMAGSIVPMDAVRQYAEEPSDTHTTLEIYPGADGSFDWYDDDGRTFAYEKGAYMSLQCRWVDAHKRLTLRRDPNGELGVGRKLNVKIVGQTVAKAVEISGEVTAISF